LNGPVPSRILSQIAVAKKVGVDSTPTFLIGRLDSPDTVRVVYRIRGTSPYATFAKVLKELVTSAKTATS